MQIANYHISPGERKEINLPVGGTSGIPAVVFCGSTPGKTLVATAGVHGCEYNGIEALRRLTTTLNPQKLCGQVILIPLLNPMGFYNYEKQIMPEDGINLNRAFPGSYQGTHSAKVAAMVEELIYPHADLLVDLHGGDSNQMAMPFAYFPGHAAPQVNEASRRAAAALSLEYRVLSSAKNGFYSWATQKGIPALLLERGGCGIWQESDVCAYMQNIYELLDYLGILSANFAPRKQKEITHTVYIDAPQNGFWYPNVTEGKPFKKGQHIGTLKDFYGNILAEYHAQFDGITLYYALALGVKKDDSLIAYGQI